MNSDETRPTRRPSRRQFEVIGAMVVVAVVAAIAGRLVLPPITSSSFASAASGAVHICPEAAWNTTDFSCRADSHQFTLGEVQAARIGVNFSGPGNRHFIGVSVWQLQPDGQTWSSVQGDSTVAPLNEGVEVWTLVNMARSSLASSYSHPVSGRYRLEAVVDDATLPPYTFDIVADAPRPPGGDPGGP